MSIRILLADDHKITREGLRSLLEKNKDTEVIGEAQNGREAVQLAIDLQPDIVIMDVSMPDLNGIEATKEILKEVENAKVIALSMHSDRSFVTEMLKSGASGYLLKDCAFDELTRAIETVQKGQIYLSPSVSGDLVSSLLNGSGQVDVLNTNNLTHREREVLQLMSEGKSTKQIAVDLEISSKTVETHRRQLMRKLEIFNVAELTKYAIRKGLTSL